MITKKIFSILTCKEINKKKIVSFESLLFNKFDFSEKLTSVYNCGENENRNCLEEMKEEIQNDLKFDLGLKLKDIDMKYLLFPESDYKDQILLNVCFYGEDDQNSQSNMVGDPIDPHFEYFIIKKVGTIKKRRRILFDGERYYSANQINLLAYNNYSSYVEYLLDYNEDEFLNKLNQLDKIFRQRKEFHSILDTKFNKVVNFSQSKLRNQYSDQLKWFVHSFFKVKSNSVIYNIRIEDINCGKVFSGALKDKDGKIDLKNCHCETITMTAGSSKNMVLELSRYGDAINIMTPTLDLSLIEEAIEEMNKDIDNINEPFIYKNINI